MQKIEVRYISPIWKSDGTLAKIITSCEPLEFLYENEGVKIESVTYPNIDKNYAVLGFAINEELLNSPYFLKSNEEKVYLVKLRDPITQKEWWTEERVNQQGKYHTGTLFNRAGKIDVIIQGKHLTIENSTFGFSYQELEAYLADFKGELWKLILNKNSLAKGNVEKDKAFCSLDDIDMFSNFIKRAEALIQKPCVTLYESIEKRSLRTIKPLPRTFREYSTNPTAKEFSSRTHIESYDTPENRYIYHIVNRVFTVLKNILFISEQQQPLFKRRIENEKERIKFFSTEKKIVNKRVFEDEIERLIEILKEKNGKCCDIEKELKEIRVENNKKVYPTCKFTVKVDNKYGNSQNQFFFSKWNGQNPKTEELSYAIIEFPDMNNNYEIFSNTTLELETSYCHFPDFTSNSKQKKYRVFQIIQLESLKIRLEELERLEERKNELEKMNWTVDWTLEEKKVNKEELAVIEKKKTLYESLVTDYNEIVIRVQPLLLRLKKVQDFFRKNKVQSRSHCPNSMVFIQNPVYSSVKSSYNKIQELSGLDESIYKSLERIEEIGLIDIPHLYERWCLLQIIDILNSVYEFELEDGWQKNIITAVGQNKKDIKIPFKEDGREQKIILFYEKILSSGKCPDFIVSLNGKRLVMDAKFKNMNEEGIQKELDNLYEYKNYSEDGMNSVFILHPNAEFAIEKNTSPLMWGETCDYGQSNKTEHCKGAIHLSPTLKYNTYENLQRLIGMFLQQNIDIEDACNHRFEKMLCTCIACGNHDKNTLKIENKCTGSGKVKYTIRCNKCGQVSYKTHCLQGDYSQIYKNGPKWTYHRTRAEEIYNIVCPSCEWFFPPKNK